MKASSVNKLFSAVQSVIFHLADKKEYQQTMNAYGLTQKRIQEGSALLQTARQLYAVKSDHYDVSRRISSRMLEDRVAALDAFRGHVTIAKSAFRKEPLVVQELKIKKLNQSQWDWMQQALDFYEKAPAYMDTLVKFGATQEGFAQNKAAIEALITLKDRRMQKKGEAEDSTQQKDAAVKALKEWYGEFRKLARIAFKKNPQILETFGIVVLSAPRKPKAKAETDDQGGDVAVENSSQS